MANKLTEAIAAIRNAAKGPTAELVDLMAQRDAALAENQPATVTGRVVELRSRINEGIRTGSSDPIERARSMGTAIRELEDLDAEMGRLQDRRRMIEETFDLPINQQQRALETAVWGAKASVVQPYFAALAEQLHAVLDLVDELKAIERQTGENVPWEKVSRPVEQACVAAEQWSGIELPHTYGDGIPQLRDRRARRRKVAVA